jgi:D-serine deaminase-like pyridoxal phosphate-dependent protein
MASVLRTRPDATEYAPFYAGYVAGVPDGDIVAVLRAGGEELASTLASIPESRGGFRYAEGKWSVREMIGHMIDAERIFAYRALRLARGDATPLPGFEQDDYVRTAGSEARTVADLAEELHAVRAATVRLFASLPDDAWTRRGVVNGREASVRALAYVTAGHAVHHLRVLRERYLAR